VEEIFLPHLPAIDHQHFAGDEAGADDGCTPSHAARIHAGVQHDDKELHVVKGATHYYIGQPDKMAEAVAIVAGWLKKKKLLD
jgi:alpha-beta hydrolase superfamily lysophospholipase